MFYCITKTPDYRMFIGIRVGEMDSASFITSTYFNIVLHNQLKISTLSHLSFPDLP